MEGLTFSPFAGATVENDRYLFQESFLCLDKPVSYVIFGDRQATHKESVKALSGRHFTTSRPSISRSLRNSARAFRGIGRLC